MGKNKVGSQSVRSHSPLCDTHNVHRRRHNSPAAGEVDGGFGVSSLPAAPIALVTRFLRLDDTITGGGATLDSPGAGTPGEECRRLAIVGLLEPPRWCAVMAECRMEDCNT